MLNNLIKKAAPRLKNCKHSELVESPPPELKKKGIKSTGYTDSEIDVLHLKVAKGQSVMYVMRLNEAQL